MRNRLPNLLSSKFSSAPTQESSGNTITTLKRNKWKLLWNMAQLQVCLQKALQRRRQLQQQSLTRKNAHLPAHGTKKQWLCLVTSKLSTRQKTRKCAKKTVAAPCEYQSPSLADNQEKDKQENTVAAPCENKKPVSFSVQNNDVPGKVHQYVSRNAGVLLVLVCSMMLLGNLVGLF